LVDPTGKQNGRGAYLCDQNGCWEKSVANNGRYLNQALKTNVSIADLETIAAHRPAATVKAELQ
jgi:predicted RNA-binding protein YlxR (DUF448 family)